MASYLAHKSLTDDGRRVNSLSYRYRRWLGVAMLYGAEEKVADEYDTR